MQLSVEIVDWKSAQRAADLCELGERGLAVPHTYCSWPAHDSTNRWCWARATDRDGNLALPFAVQLSSSRAIPGTHIARIDRVGRSLHRPYTAQVGPVLDRIARMLPRVQYLDIRVFDEDADQRQGFAESLLGVGATVIDDNSTYTRTIALELHEDEAAMLKSMAPRKRPQVTAFEKRGVGHISRIQDRSYLPRVTQLCQQAFSRTGADVPQVPLEDVFSDALEGTHSTLIGAFLNSRTPPDDLIAFAWCRLNGDHVVYDISGSEKSDELKGLSPGSAVIWQMGAWARARGATWVDLGGVTDPAAPPDHPLSGISNFKRRLATDEFDVAVEYRLHPSPLLEGIARIPRHLNSLRQRLLHK